MCFCVVCPSECVCLCVCVRAHMPALFCVCLPSASQAKSSLVQLPPSIGHHAAVERLAHMNGVKKYLLFPLHHPESQLSPLEARREWRGRQMCLNHVSWVSHSALFVVPLVDDLPTIPNTLKAGGSIPSSK